MDGTARRRVQVAGTVQGVGFRPFVYRLATELSIAGWVENTPQGVDIEIEAAAAALDAFLARLRAELPPHAVIARLDWHDIEPVGATAFEIRPSAHDGTATAAILPDLAICPDCLRELNDPADRRYRYPFINCTHCGPRFSIVEALPYDRANTTMRTFDMCPACRAEYENPRDRRFHAQPDACPVCGPHVELWDRTGIVLAERDSAIRTAAQLIRDGLIVAVKGLGGFHLMVDARNGDAVTRLRHRKQRYEKPLAIMCPSIEDAERLCHVSPAERAALTSSAAPIVLLRYKGTEIARQVAPDNPYMGVMLPYTPLHHLLMQDIEAPVVATSGNVSGDPIVTDNAEALAKLGGIANVFLVHNRPIARPVDDSVVMIVEDAPVLLRRSRGYAPAPFRIDTPQHPIVATGAHQKNVVAVAHAGSVVLSQHLGDMDADSIQSVFRRELDGLQALYAARPAAAACDLHPDYPSTRHALSLSRRAVPVQHHYAHALACIAERGLSTPVLAAVWDGTGYGTDGTIWGGEFLRVNGHGFERVASLWPFPLPGGDAAVHEPRRCALGVLYAVYGKDLPRNRLDLSNREIDVLITAMERGINAPQTTSMGRLFDAVAALLGLRQRSSFEAQAAMAVEFVQADAESDEWYPFEVTPVTDPNRSHERCLDWRPVIAALLEDRSGKAAAAARFHNTLARMIVAVAQWAGEPSVVLSGGCFQNRSLLEKAIRALRTEGFTPHWPQQVPPNDGGIAFGQIVAAIREFGHVSGRTGQVDERERDRP